MADDNRAGKLLSELIQRKGETQAQFADAMGATASQVSQWINGIRSPFSNQVTIRKMAKHFNVSSDYLLGLGTPGVDAETSEYLAEIQNRSEMRTMFKTLKGATKQDIEQAIAIVEALKKQSQNKG